MEDNGVQNNIEPHWLLLYGQMYRQLKNIYIFLCFTEESKSCRYGITWVWVNDERILIFRWTESLSVLTHKTQRWSNRPQHGSAHSDISLDSRTLSIIHCNPKTHVKILCKNQYRKFIRINIVDCALFYWLYLEYSTLTTITLLKNKHFQNV